MCPHPKREVDVRITYQGITIGHSHFECFGHVVKADAEIYRRNEDTYNIWSLKKVDDTGRKVGKYTEPCLNSMRSDPPEEAVS